MPRQVAYTHGVPVPVRLSRKTLEKIDALASELAEPRSVALRLAVRTGLAHLTGSGR